LEILVDCEIVLTQKLTEVYEEILREKTSEIQSQVAEKKIKGEITLVISGKKRKERKIG